jgi:hypothetical protein
MSFFLLFILIIEMINTKHKKNKNIITNPSTSDQKKNCLKLGKVD